MVDSISAVRLYKMASMLAFVCIVNACTFNQKQPVPFDSTTVQAMQFRFSEPVLLGKDLPAQDIASKVAANLNEWGYLVDAETGDKARYLLTVEIGEVEHAATPVGFSFSAGNSDPRALDFQKSDVVPITCVLSPKDTPDRRAELSMGFTVDAYQRYAKQPSHAKLIDLLQSDISTVCFNLLNELNVPTVVKDQSKTQSTPSWIPAIRLEIANDPEPQQSSVDGNIGENDEEADAHTPSPEHPQRKRIIIHNQGSPVIFKFGHERK